MMGLSKTTGLFFKQCLSAEGWGLCGAGSPQVPLQFKLQLTAVQDALQVRKLIVQLESVWAAKQTGMDAQ